MGNTEPRHQAAVSKQGWHRLLPFLIIGAGIFVYLNSLSGPFIFDDGASIVDNPNIRHLWPIWDAMSAPRSTGASSRPLTALSLAINYAIGGIDVLGYHVFNVGIHILTALAFFGVVRHTLAHLYSMASGAATGSLLAFAAAMIYVVHPLPTDAINHMTYRHEVLMSLFYLTTLYCAIRSLHSARKRRWWFAAILSCSLGMCSKENMISAPLMVLLYDRVFISGSFFTLLKRRWVLYAGLAGSWLLLAAAIAGGYRGNLVGFDLPSLPPYEYILTQFGVTVHYLQLALWPHPLVLDYFGWPVAQSIADVWPSVLAVTALVVATSWAIWHRKWWGLTGALFFFILAPTSLIPNAGEIAAEHRMYLPLTGIILLVVVGGDALLRTVMTRLSLSEQVQRSFAGALVGMALAGLSYATISRNEDYRSETAIWRDTVVKRPGNARAYNNLGNSLLKNREVEQAIPHLYQALKLKADFTEAHINLGVARAAQGQLERALAHYADAISINPDWSNIHNNIGLLLHRQGKTEQALQYISQALQLKPDSPIAHNNMGIILAGQGKYEEAMEHYQQALSIIPDLAEVHTNVGRLLLDQGRVEPAIGRFQQALQLKPEFAEAYFQWGRALALRGNLQEALARFAQTLHLDSDHIKAHEAIGLALMQQDKNQEAIEHFKAILRTSPDEVATLNNLGNALRRLGRHERAIAEYRRAVELAPQDATAYNNLGLALSETGQLPEACTHLEKALQLDQDFAEAHNNLGIALARQGQTQQAIEHFRSALKINPHLQAAQNNLQVTLAEH